MGCFPQERRGHVDYLYEQVKNDKNILTNQLHQLRAQQSDYLNTLINRLTVVTIILTTASVITGFYGINIGGLFPGINNPRGALLVLALIMLLAAVQFLLLRTLWKLKS